MRSVADDKKIDRTASIENRLSSQVPDEPPDHRRFVASNYAYRNPVGARIQDPRSPRLPDDLMIARNISRSRGRHSHSHSCLRNHHYSDRSEEHTSELQSLMRISYAVFCLNKKNQKTHNTI